MSLNLKSSGGGSVTVDVPSTASNYTATLPAANITVVGTSSAVSAAGQIPFSTDGSTFTPTAKIVSGTAVASTSGTSIDFTSIPSWVKRITVMFNGVSTNGSSNVQIQIGSGSVITTGYVCSASAGASGVGSATSTTGLKIDVSPSPAFTRSGAAQILLLSGTTYVLNGTVCDTTNAVFCQSGGSISLSGTIDRVRITTVNGTDTFDAGSINILYE